MVKDMNSSQYLANVVSTVLKSDKQKLQEDDLLQDSASRYSSTSSSYSTPSYIQNLRYKRSFSAQCLMNGALLLLLTGYGMPIGFSGILSPKLQEENSTLKIDPEISSWIVSVHSIATPMGSILAGLLMDEFGRKATLQLSIIPMVIGWVMISLTPNAILLIIGRLFTGFAVGMGPAPSQILIGEISEPKLRGFFGSAPSASYALGILIVYGMSSMWNWRLVAALGAILPCSGFVLLCFMPESPTWYTNKNRIEEARKSLMWLRGNDQDKADQELQSLLLLAKAKNKTFSLECPDFPIQQGSTFCTLLTNSWNKFTKPEVIRPFSIVITFAILQILSGSYIVIFYAKEFVQIATGDFGKEDQVITYIAVLTAFTRFIVSILVSILLFVVGRRTLGIISGIGTAVASALIVSYLYCKKHKVHLWGCDVQLDIIGPSNTFTIASLIIVYVAMNTLGIFSLPMMLMGETLPANVRGVMSGLFVMLVNIFIFGTTKVYPFSKNVIGPLGLFTFFSVVALVIALFIYLYLPETKDRSLAEIEYYFSTGRNHLWITRDKELYKRKGKMKGKSGKLNNSSVSLT